jgi:hypothetical protein
VAQRLCPQVPWGIHKLSAEARTADLHRGRPDGVLKKSLVRLNGDLDQKSLAQQPAEWSGDFQSPGKIWNHFYGNLVGEVDYFTKERGGIVD